MVIATIVTNYCVILSLFGLHVYLTIVVAAIYNMESTLISFYLGAYAKTPIDLSSGKVLLEIKAFNIKPC
jgi:hypothetical protein